MCLFYFIFLSTDSMLSARFSFIYFKFNPSPDMNNEPRTKKDECVWYYFTRTINVAKSNNNNPATHVEKSTPNKYTHGHTDTHTCTKTYTESQNHC